MEQIIVDVRDLSIKEKQRVNEALAKIKNIRLCDPTLAANWDEVSVMYGPSLDDINVGFDYYIDSSPTHTPQQVLEMAGMAEQGHVHAENMGLLAEDAKTHAEPWKLWQFKNVGEWIDCTHNPYWGINIKYRRKPKTHIVNGVEIPDLRIKEFNTEALHGDHIGYCADPLEVESYSEHYLVIPKTTKRFLELGILYELTEEGRQAAILHAKAWLGI